MYIAIFFHAIVFRLLCVYYEDGANIYYFSFIHSSGSPNIPYNEQNRVRQKYLSLFQKSGNLVSIAYDFKQESIQNISGVQNIRSFCQSLGSMSD